MKDPSGTRLHLSTINKVRTISKTSLESQFQASENTTEDNWLIYLQF